MYTLGEIETASGGACERETLRTWQKRYAVVLASDETLAGRHRRYTELDAVRLALVCRLVRWGLSPQDAFTVVDDFHRLQIEHAIGTVPQDSPEGDLPTRTAARLERRRTDTFIVIQKGSDEGCPVLDSRGYTGLETVGWSLLSPDSHVPCTQAALVVNLTEIARRVCDRLRSLQRIRLDDVD